MKIALFHNPGAGERALDGNQLVRQFPEAGYDVMYVPTSQKGWESAFRNSIDRAVIAGGDGTVSRLAPWLAARKIPFCILPFGTANNCAKTLGQTYPIEVLVANLRSAAFSKVDFGIVTTAQGQQVFIESVGIGLLAQLMVEMRTREKKQNSRSRLTPEERLSGAVKHLRLLAKEYPESSCELVLDDKILTGNFLLIEVANMGLIGPNVNLIPNVDPSDGAFEVVWIGMDQRTEFRDYLRLLQDGVELKPPIHTTRCHQIVFSQVDAPTHVDSTVFVPMTTPAVVHNQPGALDLLVISDGSSGFGVGFYKGLLDHRGQCLGQQRKLSAAKQDADPIISEAAEAASSMAQGLDFRIEAFGNCVGDWMKDVIEQSLKVAFEHFGYGLELRNTAANDSSIPEGKKFLPALHIGALPKGIEELFCSPGSSGFKFTTN